MTKKKLVVFHILYYVLTLLVYIAFFGAVSLLFKLSGEADNLGAAMAGWDGSFLSGCLCSGF